MRPSLIVLSLAALLGCGPGFNGKVSGYSLEVREAVFTSVNVGGESVGALLVLSDQPNLCAKLAAAKPPPDSSMAIFSLSRSVDGKRLSPDVGDYVVASEAALSGATTTGVFIHTDSNGTNAIPAANAKATSGLLKVTEYEPTGRETLTAHFDGRFGNQNDAMLGTISAKWCAVSTDTLAQGFLGMQPGIAVGGRCSRVSKCSADPRPTAESTRMCLDAEKSPPRCWAETVAFGDCYYANQQCGADNKTDVTAFSTHCSAQLTAFSNCYNPPPPPAVAQTKSFNGYVSNSEWRYLAPMQVRSGSVFNVDLSGTGDADLYVAFGTYPTASSASCASATTGSTEHCQLTVPSGETTAYVAVRGYMASTYVATITWTAP